MKNNFLSKINDYLTYTGEIEQHKIKETQKFYFWFRFRFLNLLLSPILFPFEYLRFIKVWNLVKYELTYNYKIKEWIEKQEFELVKNQFVKVDIIDENNILYYEQNDEIRNQKIKDIFNSSLFKVIKENCSTNIEDYINIQVNSSIQYSRIDELTINAELTPEEIIKLDLVNPEMVNLINEDKISENKILKKDNIKYVMYSVILRYNRKTLYREKAIMFMLMLTIFSLMLSMIYYFLF